MANLTPLNRKHFGTLRLYTQMYRINHLTSHPGKLENYFLPIRFPTGPTEDFQPSKFHVTIRHTDWWYWEDEEPLRFEYPWFQAMLDSPDLRRTETLKLELETLDYKVSQLNPIVDHIRSLRSEELATHVVNGKPTTTRFVLTGEPEVSSWTGPTDLDSKEFAPYKDKKELKYHVVTLTWKLYFPQYPKAHVPNLRLAPQVYFKRGRPASFAWRQRLERSNSMSSDDDGAMEPDMPDPVPRLDRWPPLSAHSSRRTRRRVAHFRQPTSGLVDNETSGESDEMFEWDRIVQWRSSWQARWNELFRRRQFRRCMKSQQESYWRRKFSEENSLLRLENR
jgi:hypothetical protein